MSACLIKICGITRLDDALAAVEGGATALGFNFYAKSKRYITPAAAAEIVAGLPSRLRVVGVFVNEAPGNITKIAAAVGLDTAQLHGEETPDQLPEGIAVWKAFRVDARFSLDRFEPFPQAEAFVLDGPAGAEYGGSGKAFDWRIAAASTRNVILAGGLDTSNVGEAIALARPWGVDACSKLESAPGRKDYRKMMEFLKAARASQCVQAENQK
jgi:phosphoribosylanthranilate isomerase